MRGGSDISERARRCPSRNSVASTGKVANVTLMGNADCGWLAALAEWLFSLRVEIIDHTGNPLYQSKGGSHANTGSFQLTIIRLEDGQTCALQSLLHSRTHLIAPGDLLSTSEQKLHIICFTKDVPNGPIY